MTILEVCKRVLKDGITATDPSLLKILPEVRSAIGADYVYYTSIEDPTVFFTLGVWASMDAYNTFFNSPEHATTLAPLDRFSSTSWIEHMDFGSKTIADLPTTAPVMTVTRAFLKGGKNPEEYYEKISSLKAPIEEETVPWPTVFSWTVDTTEDLHKWLMFVGWRSKKHHQDYAAVLRATLPMFSTIPAHYDEGTTHSHTTNMEMVA
jgi:quinol monooxygenase YgiN